MPIEYLHQFTLGDATITIMTLALLRWDLAREIPVPIEQRPARYAHLFEQPVRAPMRCVHIQRAGVSLLVDACTPTAFLGTEYELAGIELYPGLEQQLKSVGVTPEGVTHVVLTHAHFDHVIGVTTLRGEQFVPCFPNARHYLGRADWEDPQMQVDRNEPGAFENRTLAVLLHYGLLTLVDGDQELLPGLTLLHVPGETPGHQILQLAAGERTLYCLGDLYHDAVEVEQPTWMTSWSDPPSLLTSRQRFSQQALAEQALLIAAHIPAIGVLRATDSGVRWEDSGQ